MANSQFVYVTYMKPENRWKRPATGQKGVATLPGLDRNVANSRICRRSVAICG